MTNLESSVLDSWAEVAWIQDEPAAPFVENLLDQAESGRRRLLMSILNVGETFYIVAKRKSLAAAEQFLRDLPSMPVEIVVPSEEGIISAGRIQATHAVAYGDSFAIALAQSENATVVTGDDEIRRCGLVSVVWVGP